ncbi:queuosine 5'-phosphate N-glycosylase/hydrolase-like [Hetaerina americana]|uniref:queuosine 5'-phosphate N-glycosylase/hydrolase-like n=1 Tax=Hetaerina americana TaxID=62018 RepID=UPI003A7F3108
MAVLLPRETGKFVSSLAKSVTINMEGIKRVVDEIVGFSSKNRLILNSSAGPDNLLPKPTEEQAVDFLFVADVMNFCFWPDKGSPKWVVSWNGKSYTGYYALCAALRKAQEEKVPITDPNFYSTISEEQLRKILRPEENASEIPLLSERVAAMRQAGAVLLEKFGGTFCECVKQADKSAHALMSLIVKEFASFQDEAQYGGKRVAFYKRAQILVGDIWMLFDGRGFGEFSDIDSLTVFADYRVPQVLVHFAALEYASDLMERLRNDEVLQNGSPEEVEIRGCTVEAVERITEKLKEHYVKSGGGDSPNAIMNATQVDHFLWNFRREYAGQLECIPFHKSRCIYY